MAARDFSHVKAQNFRHGFTRALALALFEWLLIFMLFVNAIFSYLITKFAHRHELQTPCLLCSRLDHVLGNRRLKHYWDMMCQKHKLEISSLVYCHAHEKLVDVRGMCEACLFSFATFNKSNAETYRLLVGKIGEQSNDSSAQGPFLRGHDPASTGMRICTCCNQPWIPRGLTQNLVRSRSGGSKTPEPDTTVRSPFGFGKGDNKASSAGARHERRLSHVNYTELNIHSDSESEAVLTDNDCEETRALIRETDRLEEDYAGQASEPEPRIIALSDDLSTEKLIDPVFASEPSVLIPEAHSTFMKPEGVVKSGVRSNTSFGHGLEELTWPQVESKNESSATKEPITLDDTPPSYHHLEKPDKILKENELFNLDDVPLFPIVDESPVEVPQVVIGPKDDASNIRELIAFGDVLPSSASPKKPVKELKASELTTLDDLPIFPNVGETPVEVPQYITIPSSGSAVPADEAPKEIFLTDLLEKEKRNVEGNEFCEAKAGQSGPKNDSPTMGGHTAFEKPAKESKGSEVTTFDDVPLYSDADESPVEVPQDTTIPLSGPTGSADEAPKEIYVTDAVEDDKRNVEGHEEHFEDKTGQFGTAQETKPSSGYPSSPVTDALDLTDDVESEKRIVKGPEDGSELSETGAFDLTDAVEAEKRIVKGPEELREDKREQSETAQETNRSPADPNSPAIDALDLTDAYMIATAHREKQKSKDQPEQQSAGKDSSRLSEDLKALLTQLSAARNPEQSGNDISPKVSINSEELKSSDPSSVNSMQSLLQRVLLERNESNISLDGSVVSEIEGESEIDRLKRQNEHDRKLLNTLYKELEEERNASAVAANQAMAMITRLQEEKATLQMEALQNLRMMEEQSEYDMEALQRTNDLLDEKEKIIQDLKAELEFYGSRFPSDTTTKNENAVERIHPTEATDKSDGKKNILDQVEDEKVSLDDMSKKETKNWLSAFEDDRFYILHCLDKIEKKLELFSTNGTHSEATSSESCGQEDGVNESKEGDANLREGVDLTSVKDMVVDLSERLEALKADQTFLEHIITSVGHGEQGLRFIKEISSHMQILRKAGIRRIDQTPS